METFAGHNAVIPQRMTGNEAITDECGNTVGNISSFWSWAYSNVMDNAERGALAEYLVACALDVSDNVRINWNSYDLLSRDGVRIEVKSSGYLQSWGQNKLSRLTFGIQPTFGWENSTNTYSDEKKRQSDIYVFCVHKHTDFDTVNPLDTSQWEFYLLLTADLDEKVGMQKRITLSSLINIGAEKCRYGEIK